MVGACLVLPSEQADACATIDAIISNQVTIVHRVPAMFVAMVDVVRKRDTRLETVRTGFCGGSPVSSPLATQTEDVLGTKRVSNGLVSLSNLRHPSFQSREKTHSIESSRLGK